VEPRERKWEEKREGEEIGRGRRKETGERGAGEGERSEQDKEKEVKEKKRKREKKWDTCPTVSGWEKMGKSSLSHPMVTRGRIRFLLF
jgi:hypothetical protein